MDKDLTPSRAEVWGFQEVLVREVPFLDKTLSSRASQEVLHEWDSMGGRTENSPAHLLPHDSDSEGASA